MGRAKTTVSVVVPVKNDGASLAELLPALEHQTRQPDEVILVVTQSSDNTLKVAERWRPSNIKVRVIADPTANRSRARNLGVQKARGAIIVFTDAGCFPGRNWLEYLTQPFEDGKVSLVSGYTSGSRRSAFEEAQASFVLIPLEKMERHPLPATRNMAIRRAVFLQISGFREDLEHAEDFEFSRRLRAHSIHALLAPEAKVRWRPRASLIAFFLMIARLTAGDVQASIVRPGLITMWVRYFIFIFLILLVPLVGAFVYAAYVLIKVSGFRFRQVLAYVWAAPLQIVCDAAVLTGSSAASLKRIFLAIRPRKRDNTINVD